MKKYWLFFLGSFLLLSTNKSWAIDGTDTRLLWQPAIGKDRIAFIYAEDLWIANKDGSYPRRITSSEGVESNPVFSPGGRWSSPPSQRCSALSHPDTFATLRRRCPACSPAEYAGCWR